MVMVTLKVKVKVSVKTVTLIVKVIIHVTDSEFSYCYSSNICNSYDNGNGSKSYIIFSCNQIEHLSFLNYIGRFHYKLQGGSHNSLGLPKQVNNNKTISIGSHF